MLKEFTGLEEFGNLYFVGAGTYPGAGVPAVLSYGKIAAHLFDPTPELVIQLFRGHSKLAPQQSLAP